MERRKQPLQRRDIRALHAQDNTTSQKRPSDVRPAFNPALKPAIPNTKTNTPTHAGKPHHYDRKNTKRRGKRKEWEQPAVIGTGVMSMRREPKNFVESLHLQDGKLKVAIVGGAEEVGRNCTMLEYEGDIIIIDMGLQFPEEDMPGIDYIIPNMSYFKNRKKDIKGLIITHAHMDHIGGIPHVMEDLGNPVIYTGKLTKGIIEKRHENYPLAPKLKFSTVEENSKLKLGKFDIEFCHVNHNIINCFGVYVSTPAGTVFHTGDFKFDSTPLNDKPTDYARLAELGKKGIDVLLADSTNAASPGRQMSEYAVTTELDKIFTDVQGRIIIGTFASNLNRIQQCVTLAEKYGRKVILEGRSINSNVEIAHQLKSFDVNMKNLVEAEEYVRNRDRYPDNKVVIVGTGAQGERNAFMMKYVNAEHRFLRAEKGDTCIFSSSVIPGNERTVQNLMDALARKGCKLIHYQLMDVHAGGHAKQEDLRELIQILKPKYYVPIEQSRYSLQLNGNVALQEGYPEDRVYLIDNGQVMEFEKKGSETHGKLTDKYIPTDYVFVDGLGVGDVSNIVLRDRLIMSQDGMVVVIATIDHKTGRLLGNPDIISRGFIYMKENKQVIEETRMKVKKICIDSDKNVPAFDDHIKNIIRDDIGEFLFSKTRRRPMVLPVIIKV